MVGPVHKLESLQPSCDINYWYHYAGKVQIEQTIIPQEATNTRFLFPRRGLLLLQSTHVEQKTARADFAISHQLRPSPISSLHWGTP
jgi:hypothetical protein